MSHPSRENSLPEPFSTATRVLFLHAHPDDESLATGGTIATLTSRGVPVTIVTGTRGERGEVMAGPLALYEGTPKLAGLREQELARAISALGVTDQRFLGTVHARAAGRAPRRYRDSGMQWGTREIAVADPHAGPDALSVAPLEEVAADLSAVIGTLQPDLVVTYDARGGYGHPDHVRMHDAGVLAGGRAGLRVLTIDPGVGNDASSDRIDVDISAQLSAKRSAIAAHRSQVSVEGDVYRLSGGQTHPIFPTESFRLHVTR